MTYTSVPAVWMRGGTAKGLFFQQHDLPEDRRRWNDLFLAAMGSPDPFGNQLDGLGGASPATSQIAVVGPSQRGDCDIDCHFGLVSVADAAVLDNENCANLCAAAGPFAIHAGMIEASGEAAQVRIWHENLQRRIEVRVPLQDGRVLEAGHCHIDGVRGSGAAIQVCFPPSEGNLLPTGEILEDMDGGLHASVVDLGRPTVFLLASEVGVNGSEGAEELLANTDCLQLVEDVRAEVARTLGRDDGIDIMLIAPPQDYPTPRGHWVWAEGIRLTARLISKGRPHRGCTDSAALALAVAAQIPGSLVQQLARPVGEALSFGHASGLLRVSARVVQSDQGWVAETATLERTARRLMAGRVFLPDGLDE